ncbi:DUF6062 family protein [Thermococcus barophilus]|nr:DUF6062 family protein [Thermococcus barophilus]
MAMDLIGIYLREAFQGTGCPICRIVEKYEREVIGHILYEHINSPSVREKFSESLGLCPYHAWKLKDIAYSNPLYGGLGVAIIYEHMLSIYLNALKDEKKIEDGKCYLCELTEVKEKHTVEATVDRMDKLIEDYRNSEAILCKKHFEEIEVKLRRKNPELAEELKKVQIGKLEKIKTLMHLFIEKFDYRATKAPTEQEASSVPKAIESLKGLPLQINFVKRQKQHSILRGVLLGNRD